MIDDLQYQMDRITATIELQTMLVVTMARVIRAVVEDRTPDFKKLGLDLEKVNHDMDMALRALQELRTRDWNA